MGIKSWNPGTTEEQRNAILARDAQSRKPLENMLDYEICSVETGQVIGAPGKPPHKVCSHFAVFELELPGGIFTVQSYGPQKDNNTSYCWRKLS